MMKRTTLLDKRYPTTKFSYHGPDANTYRQVIDSHLEALDEIERLKEELETAKSRWGENGAQA